MQKIFKYATDTNKSREKKRNIKYSKTNHDSLVREYLVTKICQENIYNYTFTVFLIMVGTIFVHVINMCMYLYQSLKLKRRYGKK